MARRLKVYEIGNTFYGKALIVNGFVADERALWATLESGEGQLEARTFWYEHIGSAERAARIRQAASSS
jgi:hypothetical protein